MMNYAPFFATLSISQASAKSRYETRVGHSQTYTDYAQEVLKAGAGSHGPIGLQTSMHAPEVPFAWNVNRMEGLSFIAGAGV